MKHLIFIFIIALFSVKCHEEELDPEYIKQINEEIMKNLKEMNITNTQTISKAQFVVLFKRLFEKNNPKGEGVPPSAVEDQFMFDVVRAVIKDVPEQISIHDIYKYMDQATGSVLPKLYYTALGRERYSMYRINRNLIEIQLKYKENP